MPWFYCLPFIHMVNNYLHSSGFRVSMNRQSMISHISHQLRFQIRRDTRLFKSVPSSPAPSSCVLNMDKAKNYSSRGTNKFEVLNIYMQFKNL